MKHGNIIPYNQNQDLKTTQEYPIPCFNVGHIFQATIQREHDVSATFTLRIISANLGVSSALILASIEDANCVCPSKSGSHIDFPNLDYDDFTFMEGEVYNKSGRLGKRHVMIQLNGIKHLYNALPSVEDVQKIKSDTVKALK